MPNFEKDDIDICEMRKRVTEGEEIRYMIVIDGLFPNIIDSGLKRGTLVRIFSASGKSFLEVRCPQMTSFIRAREDTDNTPLWQRGLPAGRQG